MAAGEIGVEGLVGSIKKDEEDAATEPGELGSDVAEGIGGAFGSQPIRFVGEVEAVGRFRGNLAGGEERDDGRRSGYDKHQREEGLLGHPAIGSAAEIEVRGHERGKVGINAGPGEQAEQ